VTLTLSGPEIQTNDGNFGVRSNRFGFTVTRIANQVVVIEASTNLLTPSWIPIHTNTPDSGPTYFSDPNSIDHLKRFYRLRMQ
jgi:hypothetical protein